MAAGQIHKWAERASLVAPASAPRRNGPWKAPADVFVPSLGGIPTACDMAVTAPQYPS